MFDIVASKNKSFTTNRFINPFPDPEIRGRGHRAVVEYQMALSLVGQCDLGASIHWTQPARTHFEEAFAGQSDFIQKDVLGEIT